MLRTPGRMLTQAASRASTTALPMRRASSRLAKVQSTTTASVITIFGFSWTFLPNKFIKGCKDLAHDVTLDSSPDCRAGGARRPSGLCHDHAARTAGPNRARRETSTDPCARRAECDDSAEHRSQEAARRKSDE